MADLTVLQRHDRRALSRRPRPLLRTLRKGPRIAWLAACVGGRLCLLPVLLRIYTLSELLQRLTHVRVRRRRATTLEMEDVVRIVVRVSNLRPFRWRIFPRSCLRQSLTLHRTLTRLGYRSEIHFGVQKQSATLLGHSWVTIDGRPVAATTQRDAFDVVYSYPSRSELTLRHWR